MSSPIVFLDFAGPDSAALKTFYSQIFEWDAGAPQFPVATLTPLMVAVREDPAEKRIYVGVDDVAGKLAQIQSLGGSIDQERFEVPGVVVLGLFRDPAGNPMGLVEMDGETYKAP